MSREYKQRTKILGIPVVGHKDGIYPEVELRKWQLVENFLLAASRSLRNCIFEEGAWGIKEEADDTFTVMLSNNASMAAPSVSGVIKGTYFCGGPTVSWVGLQAKKRHFLYLNITRETRLNPKSIRAYSSDMKATGWDSMTMGILDLTGEKPVLDKHPEGKVYADSMAAPGRMLHPEIVDFRSEGKKGFLVSSQRKIAFVQVSRMYAGSWDGILGDVAVGYYGPDESVENGQQAIVYNSGDSGIPLRAIIFCQ